MGPPPPRFTPRRTCARAVDHQRTTPACYDPAWVYLMGDVVRKVKGGRFVGWYVRYRDTDGKRKQRASHQPTHALARRYLLAIEGRIARGVVGIPEPAAPSPTVQELVERFLDEYSRPKIKDLDKYRLYARTALRRVLPLCGEP